MLQNAVGPLPDGSGLSRRDWLLVGLLVLLVLPLRLWLLTHTEVTARDSVGYIRYALQLENKPWQEVWANQPQHPGYPIAVRLMSVPVRAWAGGTTPESMQWSAQLAGGLASLLLVVPMYFLGKHLLGRPVGFWGSLLFQYWPVSSHHLSDGVSETMFLLLLVSAILAAVVGIERRCPWRCGLAGLFTGLAYLTRPEGALVLPAAGLVLLVQQCVPAWRVSWGRWFACAAAGLLVAVAVGSIYVQTTGRITNKLSAREVIAKIQGLLQGAPRAAGPSSTRLAAVGPAPLLAATYAPTEVLKERLARSARALLMELNQGFHYVGTVFAVLGLWWSFGALRARPGFWLIALYCLIHAAILFALAMVVFYVSDRHTMILVLFGTFLVVVGARELPGRVLSFLSRAPEARAGLVRLAGMTLLLGLIALSLPRTLLPLHGNRFANHAAGLWLRNQVQPGDVVIDDHAWSHYFAGLLFEEDKDIRPAPGSDPSTYTVVTTSSERHGEPRNLPPGPLGDAVYRWPESGHAVVTVYRRPRDPKREPW